jgi:hypothetical protein
MSAFTVIDDLVGVPGGSLRPIKLNEDEAGAMTRCQALSQSKSGVS